MLGGGDRVVSPLLLAIPLRYGDCQAPGGDLGARPEGRSLETLTDAVGDSLPRTADDNVDPDRITLQVLSEFLHPSAILKDDHLLEFGRALVADPRLTDGVAAFAGLA